MPQGGNTGLAGGGVPSAKGDAIVLSLGRMNRVRALDPLNDTITVEAGVVLQRIQEAAAEADRLFPLSLGAEGSCMIGGNLSTNAGGTGVLRYGNARGLVLGLEVVLPDGRVWDGLRGLRKDNTGYDLKQLFIGAEGTLGVITAAVLRLFPRPRDVVTAMVAVRDVHAAVELLALMRGGTGESVTGFELMTRMGMESAVRHIEGVADPFDKPYGHYVLIECTSAHGPGPAARRRRGRARGRARRGASCSTPSSPTAAPRRASSGISARSCPRRRNSRAAASSTTSPCRSRASPISSPRPTRRSRRRCRARGPSPSAMSATATSTTTSASRPAWTRTPSSPSGRASTASSTTSLSRKYKGSISAEHGIGLVRRADLGHYKSEVELDLMRQVKAALDPQGLMNPGKIF